MPRTVDHQERRSKILEAFVRVATRQGLASVSLRAVAIEAGISLRLIQYYFETKSGLMQAGLESLEQESNQKWARRTAKLPQPPTTRSTLRALFEEALPTDEASRYFHLLWMSYAILAQTDAGNSNRPFIDGPKRMEDRIVATLARGKENGEIRRDVNIDAEAAILLGLLNGFGTAVLLGQMTADRALACVTNQLDRLSSA